MVPQLEAGIFRFQKGNAGPTEQLAPERDQKRTTLDNTLSPNGASGLGVSMCMPAWRIYPRSKHPYLLQQDLQTLEKPNIAEQSLLYAQKIVELAKDNTLVTWIDNYNKSPP